MKHVGNMLYLDPCLHSFCFSCTQGLLETQAECPCCKQPISSIFHSVKKKESPEKLTSMRYVKDKPSPTPSNRKEHMALSSRKPKGNDPLTPFKSHSDNDILPCEDHTFPSSNVKRSFKHSSVKPSSKENPCLDRFEKSESSHECYDVQIIEKKPSSDQVFHESIPHEAAFSSPPECAKSHLKRPSKPSSTKSPKKHLKAPVKPNAQQESHLHALRKMPISDRVSLESIQDAVKLDATPKRSILVDVDIDMLRYRAISANLSKPNMLEGLCLLLSSGALVFVCVYIYLQIVVI
nr:PREDICTED: uncharacterized protein LOC107983474 [Anolis carolinensis]|eukprot:XP_016852780.1 PREDICTED: uncharacterized protein LOC107983474 [Anolis carolinensis]